MDTYYMNFCICELVPCEQCYSKKHRCIKLRFNKKYCYCTNCVTGKISKSLFHKPLEFSSDISRFSQQPIVKETKEIKEINKEKDYFNALLYTQYDDLLSTEQLLRYD